MEKTLNIEKLISDTLKRKKKLPIQYTLSVLMTSCQNLEKVFDDVDEKIIKEISAWLICDYALKVNGKQNVKEYFEEN